MGQHYKRKITADPNLWIGLSVMLLLVPISWMIAWITATLIHELFHCLGVLICGNRILHVYVGVNGARIETDESEPWKELISLLAGPLGALIVLIFACQLPRVAICVLVQSVYNLLPLAELDGGQILLRLSALITSPQKAETICDIGRMVTCALVLFIGIYGTLWLHLGLFPLIMTAVFILRHGTIKKSCKRGAYAVQW